ITGPAATGPAIQRPLATLPAVEIASMVANLDAERIRRLLHGLPEAEGYVVLVKPLRYRTRPHLSAWTEFEHRRITLQMPQPFLPFGEVIPYGARRLPGKGLRF